MQTNILPKLFFDNFNRKGVRVGNWYVKKSSKIKGTNKKTKNWSTKVALFRCT